MKIRSAKNCIDPLMAGRGRPRRRRQAAGRETPVIRISGRGAAKDAVVIYDAQGYDALEKFLQEHGVRHVLLTGYAADMCFRRTTAGYENLAQDFNVFLVGDATLATFPANASPRHATNAAISFASLYHLITQVSWVRMEKESSAEKADTP